MNDFKQQCPKSSGVDFQAFHSWQDVLTEASGAVEEHHAKAKGLSPSAFITKWFRKAGDVTPVVEILENVLPGGEYTSIVCGA